MGIIRYAFLPKLVSVFHQKVDVVQAVHQAMLLVGIDFEVFAAACGSIGDGLCGQVYGHLRLRIGGNGVEQFLQEVRRDDHRQHEVVELVVLVDIGKEAAHYHTESISCNGPGSMFAAGTAAEVLSGYQNAAVILGIVEHKVRIQRAVGTIAPVAEQVVAEEFLFPGRCLQKAGGDDLVCVHILQRKRHTGTGYDVKFLFHCLAV